MKNIWVPLSGAIAQQRNVEVIANNVANANTPGFKQDQLVFKEYLTALQKGTGEIDIPKDKWEPSDFYRTYDSENAYVKVDGSYTNHKQGQLIRTENPFDLAIRGPGFFEVLTPNGIRYTRAGAFSLSNDGFLVNSLNHPVLGRIDLKQEEEGQEAGPPPQPSDRKILLRPGKLSINFQGEVFVDNSKVGEISVTEFKDVFALRKEGHSLFINRDIKNIMPNDSKKSTVNQGFIEGSNVNAVQAMSDLIKANRQFETIQRAMKAYDDITGKGINEIAKF